MITGMEKEMEALSKSAGLFEVSVPDYKQLKACHKEVRLLKELWDVIVLVRLWGVISGMGQVLNSEPKWQALPHQKAEKVNYRGKKIPS